VEKVRLKNPVLIILVFSIRFYQILISPILGPKCRFYPSCSQYCIESLKKFGFFKGIFFSFMRLKECHPFGKSGFDPVREKIEFKNVSLKEIRKLRKIYLYSNNLSNLSNYKEDTYKKTKHYGIFKDHKLVSGLTLIENTKDLKEKDVQIRGMFTIKSEMKKGYGSMLIENVIIKSKQKNIQNIWCNARISALKFYKKNKFIEVGEKFNIPLVGYHKKLARKL